MTVYDFLQDNSAVIRKMLINGIDPGELRHLALIEDYRRMKAESYKTLYIVAVLSDKYRLAESSVYRIVKQLSRDI